MRVLFQPGDIARVVADRYASGDDGERARIGSEVQCHGYAGPNRTADGWDLNVSVEVADPEEPTGMSTRAQTYDERDLEFTGRTVDDVASPEWRRGVESGDVVSLRLIVPTLDCDAAERVLAAAAAEIRELLPRADVWGNVSGHDDEERDIYLHIRSLASSATAMAAALLRRWPTTFARVEDDGWGIELEWSLPSGRQDEERQGQALFIDPSVRYGWLSTWPWGSPVRRLPGEAAQWRKLRCGELGSMRHSAWDDADEPTRHRRLIVSLGVDDGSHSTAEAVKGGIEAALAGLAANVVVEQAGDGTAELVATQTGDDGRGAPEFLVGVMAAWPGSWLDLRYDGRAAAVSWKREFEKWSETYNRFLHPAVQWARLQTAP